MELKKILFGGLCLAVLAAGFTSCSDDDDNSWKEGSKVDIANTHAFMLNEGNMARNNSNLIYFDWSNDSLSTSCIYQKQNEKSLGDTGNDICVYDNKMLVAVNGSNYLALLNGSGVELSRISFESFPNLGAIRSVAAANGYAFVSSYGGYLSKIRINGNSLIYEDSLTVGSYPEGVACLNGKVYCSVSGWGQDNRVAVVDASSFTTPNYITVMYNPDNLVVEDGLVFVQGYGEYDAYYNCDYPWGVIKDNKYTQLGNASCFAAGNGKVYASLSKTDWTSYPYKTVVTTSVYDIESGKTDNAYFTNFPAFESTLSVYSISVNPYSGHVYWALTDRSTDGTIYHFDEKGKFVKSFSSNGVNTNKIVFLKN